MSLDLAVCADQAPSRKWPPRGSRLAVTIPHSTDTGKPSSPNLLGSYGGKEDHHECQGQRWRADVHEGAVPHVWLSPRAYLSSRSLPFGSDLLGVELDLPPSIQMFRQRVDNPQ